jgi:hypothetical protein
MEAHVMPNIVRAFPLIRPVSELHAFLSELKGARSAETDSFYRQYGVTFESVHIQETAQVPLLIVGNGPRPSSRPRRKSFRHGSRHVFST